MPFFGCTGAHDFHAGRIKSGVACLVLFWGGLATVWFGIGLVMLFAWFWLWVIAAFLLSKACSERRRR